MFNKETNIINSGEKQTVQIADQIYNITQESDNNKYDSYLADVIYLLSKNSRIKKKPEFKIPEKYRTEDKIPYNNVITYKHKIDSYQHYFFVIDKILNNLDQDLLDSKDKILGYINDQYIDVLSKIQNPCKISSIELIKQNADYILQEVECLLLSDIKSMSRNSQLTLEGIKSAIPKIVVHAFIVCEILEKPPNDYVIK